MSKGWQGNAGKLRTEIAVEGDKSRGGSKKYVQQCHDGKTIGAEEKTN